MGGVITKFDPTSTGGYIAWEVMSNANSYQISTFYKDALGTYIPLSQTITSQNYFRFDPQAFQLPNSFYQIAALNSSGGTIDATDIRPMGPSGYVEPDLVCQRICNGKSYAYRLQTMQSYTTLSDGTLNPNNKNMVIASQPHYQNATIGLKIPYWQAISLSAWNGAAYLSDHPYKSVLGWGGSGNYLKVQISQSGLTGTFYDKSNTPVGSDGILVEKKFDQFIHFTGKFTPQNYLLPNNICSNSLNGIGSSWINTFNDGVSSVNYPTNPNPFTGTIVHDLECIPATTTNPGGADTNTYGGTWGGWLTNIYDQLFDFTIEVNPGGPISWDDFSDAIEVLGNFDSGEGGVIVGVIVKSASRNENTFIEYTRNNLNDTLRIREASGDLQTGLYTMYVFTSTGEVLPHFFEISHEVPMPLDKAFVELTLAPNPIANKNLHLNINASKYMQANLLVNNMYGTLLYNQILNLNDGTTEVIDTDLTNAFIPMNQIVISLVLPDGSVIQKIASTLN